MGTGLCAADVHKRCQKHTEGGVLWVQPFPQVNEEVWERGRRHLRGEIVDLANLHDGKVGSAVPTQSVIFGGLIVPKGRESSMRPSPCLKTLPSTSVPPGFSLQFWVRGCPL